MNLEPIFEKERTNIFYELSEVNWIIFFDDGAFEVGYEFNGEKKYPLKFKNSNVIGAYYVTFNKKSGFIYRTATECKGYFIRRKPWMNIMESHEQVTDEFKA